ncbi:ribonuclease P protein subunit p29 [Apiospora kogelbergensis]|uniref:Ribonuclease P protein subunit n=1 Tax=Apiospora kogelbergensis TaxID=1337665 RepID=A0AAW0QGD5_9PEZI
MASSNAQPLTQELLARGHSPDSASRIYSDKIQYRPLYLRANSPPPSTNARAARRKARDDKNRKRKSQKPKPLSASQRRKLGFYDIPKHKQQYAVFAPLKQLWIGYMREVLGSNLHTGGLACAAKLCAAEYHGAEVEVTRSSCPSRVGLKGIVVKDSRFAFEIVTPKNERKLVPKEGTMFRLHIPAAEQQQDAPDPTNTDTAVSDADKKDEATTKNGFTFEILGDQFQYRAADRANRKFKAHFLDKL